MREQNEKYAPKLQSRDADYLSAVKRGDMETAQLINANNRPNATPESGSVVVSNPIIPDTSKNSNPSNKKRLEQSRDADYLSAVERDDMETAREYNKADDLFIQGIRNASDNLAYTENTTGEGGVKLYGRQNIINLSSDEDIVQRNITSGNAAVKSLIEQAKKSDNPEKLVFDKAYSSADYRTVEIASNKKATLDLVTLFITKNKIKGNQSVPPATVNSSSQRGSVSSINSISQPQHNSNPSTKNNSPHQDHDSDYLSAVERGDMETAREYN